MWHVEDLEKRRYFALGTGVITINGTDAAENWRITQSGSTIVLRNSAGTLIDQSSGTVTGVIINLNGGADTLRLFNVDGTGAVTLGVSINGGDGNDVIFAAGGADTIRGQNGNDTILGGAGNDRLIGGLGNDNMNGEAGSDTADYSNNTFSVAVSLDGVANDGIIGQATDTDTISNFENIMGGAGNDILVGDANANSIDGGGGNDAIAGRNGNDTLTGGIGIDTIWGEDGADSLFAKEGFADAINDGAGTDVAQIDTSPADFATNATPIAVASASLAMQSMLRSMGFEAMASEEGPESELDTRFNPTGDPAGTVYLAGTAATVGDSTSQVIDGENKTYLAGSKDGQVLIARLGEDGTLDADWGVGGYLTVTPGSASSSDAVKIRVAADGKVLILANARYGGATALLSTVVIQLNADGTLDTSFGADDPQVGNPAVRLGYVVAQASGSNADIIAADLLVKADGDGNATDIFAVSSRHNPSENTVMLSLTRFNGSGVQVSNNSFRNTDIGTIGPVAAAFGTSGNILVVTDAVGQVGASLYEWDPTATSLVDVTFIPATGLTSFRPTDFAVDEFGGFYLVGNGTASGSAYGMVISGTIDGGVRVYDSYQLQDAAFSDVAIDKNGAAAVAGTGGGNVLLYQTDVLTALPDVTFGDNGVASTPVGGVVSAVSAGVSIDSIDRIVVGGVGFDDGGQASPMAARFGALAELLLDEVDPNTLLSPKYFIDRIVKAGLDKDGNLTFSEGGNGAGPMSTSALSDPALDDTFVIGRRFNVNGEEYFWVEHNNDVFHYSLAQISTITINGGAGHLRVRVENALGVPLTIIGEEDNTEIEVGTTPYGTPDGSDRGISSVSTPANGTTVLYPQGAGTADDIIIYRPAANYYGSDSFSYTIDNPSGADPSGTVNIELTPVNDAPTDLAISNDSIEENKPAGTQVGVFSTTDIDDTTGFAYELVSGEGDADNSSFNLSTSGVLTNKVPFDFELKKEYVIRVRTTDPGGLSHEESLKIFVIDVVEPIRKFTGTVIGTNPSGTANAREKAFDGSFTTYFKGASSDASTAWVGLDMGTAQVVTRIRFAPKPSGGALMVGGRFQGSNDATFTTGVTTIYTIATAPTSGVLTDVAATQTGLFRYFRYIGPANSYGQIGEIEFLGPTDQTKPSKPGRPVLTSQGLTSLSISWTASTDNVGVARYDIYRNGTKIDSTTNLFYTATGLKPGTSYSLQVLAVDAAGNQSPLSDALAATTTADTAVPTVPTNLRGGTITRTSIQLLWDASTDNVAIESYRIYRDGKLVGTVTAANIAQGFTSTGLKANTVYKFTVQAVDSSGNVSLLSLALSLKTLA